VGKIKESFIFKCLRCEKDFITKTKAFRLCRSCRDTATRGGGESYVKTKGYRNGSKAY